MSFRIMVILIIVLHRPLWIMTIGIGLLYRYHQFCHGRRTYLINSAATDIMCPECNMLIAFGKHQEVESLVLLDVISSSPS
ncbi:hypothetical protein B0T13DRAFT_162105 [Neurospora crassa]|nr:hypothetical protein B0T13DRAFT_162105 [Neurospora crassa]